MIFIALEITTRLFYNNLDELPESIKSYLSTYSTERISISGHYPLEEIIRFEDDGLAYFRNGSIIRNYMQFGTADISETKDEDVFRIVIVGDSFVAGAGVPVINGTFLGSYVPVLKDLFKDVTIDNKRVEILSFAFGGLNMRQKLELYKKLGSRYSPDLVVLQFCPNDFDPMITVFRPIHENNKVLVLSPKNVVFIDRLVPVPSFPFLDVQTNKFILKNSFLMRFISFRLNSVLQNEEYNAGNGYGDLRELSDILEKKEIPLIVVNFPLMYNASRYSYYFCDGKLLSDVKRFSAREGIIYYDLCNDLNYAEHKSDNIKDSGGHYNYLGYEIAAKKTLKLILETII